MRIDDFENEIDATILGRGQAYFEEGAVVELEQVRQGLYEATVAGSDDYIVEVEIRNGEVKALECDCPYDYGPVCKHEVAVLYAIREIWEESEVGESGKIPGIRKKGKGKDEKSMSALTSLVNSLSLEELRSFLLHELRGDGGLQLRLQAAFPSQPVAVGRDYYEKLVSGLVGRGKRGYYERGETSDIADRIDDLLDIAKAKIQSGDFQEAFDIATVLLNRVGALLSYCDEDDDNLRDCLYEVIEILKQLLEASPPRRIRDAVLEYCLWRCKSHPTLSEDWDWKLLDLAITLAESEEEVRRIIDLLESLGGDEWEQRRVQLLEYDFLLSKRGKEAAESFMLSHLDNDEFCQRMFEQAMEEKDYARARQLAERGRRQSEEKGKYGLVSPWVVRLRSVAKMTGDAGESFRLSRELLVEHLGKVDDYFPELKAAIPAAQWPAYLEALAKDLERRGATSSLAEIYCREVLWEPLFNLLKRGIVSGFWAYEQRFPAEYRPRIADLYAVQVLEMLESFAEKRIYTDACELIRRIKALGEGNLAQQIIAELRVKYKRRRLLMEELDQLEKGTDESV